MDNAPEGQPHTAQVQYFRLRITFRNGLEMFLHCQEWEVMFARFWGRLLCAADKYCVDDLAELCSQRMLSRLSVWNAATMLGFAVLTGQRTLQHDIMDFITVHPSFHQAVMNTPGFDDLDHNLQNELTQRLLKQLWPAKGVKRRSEEEARPQEFPDGHDWNRLSCAQLRRACAERGLPTGGGHAALVGLLGAQGCEGG